MKKILFIILCGLTFGLTANAQVLNVPTIEQEQDMWCWDGVCKSALDYYGYVHSQCEIAEWVRTVSSRGYGTTPCCENPSGPCNQGNSIYNENGSMQDILLHYAGITSVYKGQFSRTEADVSSSIARNAVVPCGWNWMTGGGHAVLIHGYVSGNVYYMDPWFGEGKKIQSYAAFSSGNDGSGQHTWTQGIYFTSDVSHVDTIPCATPSNLAVANVVGTTVSLSWNAVASAQSYTIQYRVVGSSSWLSTTSSTNSISISGLAANTTYEFAVASLCNQVSNSSYSASVTATTQTPPLVYCASKGNSVNYEWAQKVQVGAFTNNSGKNGGYADFTASVINLTKGQATTVILTPGFTSTTYNETWRIFADLNKDGDFTDAGEILYTSANSKVAVSGSITIPVSATNGNTRLRVSMKYNAAPTACETFSEGEVEDYTLNIADATPPSCDVVTNLATPAATNNSLTVSWAGDADATSYNLDYRVSGGSWTTVYTTNTAYTLSGLSPETTYEVRVATVCSFGSSSYSSSVSATTQANPTCNTPSGLSAGTITNSSITASWSSVANAVSYNLEIRPVNGSWTTVSKTTTSHSFTGLSASTAYEIRVSTVCSFGNSPVSAVLSATTISGPPVYCASTGNTANEWIKSVQLGSINNVSNANGGYANFTTLIATINSGSSANITLTPGFPPALLYGYITQPEFWSVWIDLNQDGDFTDANEQRFVSSASSTVAVTASISIPAGTPVGTTRMRVAMKRSLAATSCETYTQGEVEDYTINITAPLGGASANGQNGGKQLAQVSSKIYPNPAKESTTVEINIPKESGTVTISLSDISGKIIQTKVWPTSTEEQSVIERVNLDKLPKGIYLLRVSGEIGLPQMHKLVVE